MSEVLELSSDGTWVLWVKDKIVSDLVIPEGVTEIDETISECRLRKKTPATGLCVHLPNGDFIQESTAASTFVAAIIKADLLRVRALDLKLCGINIVSTTIDKKYGSAQREAAPGLYILTHSNTQDKKKLLDKISSALKLGWRVDIIR